MTFDANQPNAAQSPGIFPVGSNTNWSRLKTLINAEHVFNDTLAPDDGVHRRVSLVNQADPGAVLPAGVNSIVYGKTSSDSVNELWFYNGVSYDQLNWRQLQGTVNVTSAFGTIVAIPPNCYGYIYLFKITTAVGSERTNVVQAGTFVSSATVVNGYSYAEKYEDGTGASQILRLAFEGSGENGLNLTVRNDSGSKYAGTWQYRIFYRQTG